MPTDPKDAPQLLGEISQGPSAFEQFLDRNQKNLVILCIAITLGVAGFLIYQGIATSHERSAGAMLCQADDLTSLQSLVKEYPATAAAGSAKIALAERQWQENQQPAAIDTLKAFIADNPKHPALPTAKASLGAKLKFLGKTAEATSLFQELADDPDNSYLAPYALISLGDLAQAAGQAEQAETFYQKAKSAVPGNAFSTTADQRLANLKVKLPVEVDPPPPAPPPALVPPPPLPDTPDTAPGTPTPVIPGAGGDPDTDVPPVNLIPGAGSDPNTDVPPVNMIPGAGEPTPPPSPLTPAEVPAETPAEPATDKPATPPSGDAGGNSGESPQEPAAPARSEDPAPPAGAPPAP
jgi:predicted negative regulator of RcsB-dependent stress response